MFRVQVPLLETFLISIHRHKEFIVSNSILTFNLHYNFNIKMLDNITRSKFQMLLHKCFQTLVFIPINIHQINLKSKPNSKPKPKLKLKPNNNSNLSMSWMTRKKRWLAKLNPHHPHNDAKEQQPHEGVTQPGR